MTAVTTRLREPRTWLVVALVVAPLGIALGGGWVTAEALLTLLVALAPCLLMCALGLCVRHGRGTGCQRSTAAANETASRLTTKEL